MFDSTSFVVRASDSTKLFVRSDSTKLFVRSDSTKLPARESSKLPARASDSKQASQQAEVLLSPPKAQEVSVTQAAKRFRNASSVSRRKICERLTLISSGSRKRRPVIGARGLFTSTLDAPSASCPV